MYPPFTFLIICPSAKTGLPHTSPKRNRDKAVFRECRFTFWCNIHEPHQSWPLLPSKNPSYARYAAMTRATAVTHIGTGQPAKITSHRKASRRICMTATRRKITPAAKENVLCFIGSSTPARGIETFSPIILSPTTKKNERARYLGASFPRFHLNLRRAKRSVADGCQPESPSRRVSRSYFPSPRLVG